MGSGTVNKEIDFTSTIVACYVDFTVEYYHSSAGAWATASVGTPDFITTMFNTNGDFDIELDGVDAASVAYRPETSKDLRITAFLEDSIATAASITDTFTITIEDACKDDQLTFTGTSTSA